MTRLGRRRLPVLAEIEGGQRDDAVWAGALQRREVDAYSALLERLEGVGMVLVTGDAEGKATVAIGLAATAVAAGRQAALLECDLARPRLAASLGLAPTPGLHEYLKWTTSASQIVQPLVLAGPGSGAAGEPLACVVAGEPTPHGGTLLAAEGFAHATARLREAYELVVVSGPPLTGEEFALARAVAPADVALACVHRSLAKGRPARRLARELRRLPRPCAGLVAIS